MDVPVIIDRGSDRPLHVQLSGQIRQNILDGLLPGGTRLPSTRQLAESLGVSRNVVLTAYDELYAEGCTETRHGSGTYVIEGLNSHLIARPVPDLASPRWLPDHVFLPTQDPPPTPGGIDFRLGRPSIAPLPLRSWQRFWREMAMEEPPNDYGPTEGFPELRAEVAAYLGRSRGIACTADDVVMTSGAMQPLDLLLRTTLSPDSVVALEEPGYPMVRKLVRSHGATLLSVPVDSDGLCVDRLPDGPNAPLLIYCTPSHQYPTGARMPVSRRLALLEWASRNDSLIVEDDYDSEFRFDASPLPAMAGLDETGRVVYIGTFSKMLTPALRMGYVVATPVLLERLVALKSVLDRHVPWPTQRVMTSFLSSGRLESHIARMRRYYARKRKLLSAIIEPLGDLARLQGLEAGLHVYLELDPRLDANGIAAEAARRGVTVTTIDNYFAGPSDRSGLLLGYGGLSTEELNAGARILVDVIRAAAVATALPRA